MPAAAVPFRTENGNTCIARERRALAERQRLFVLPLRFAAEARNNVRRDRAVRHFGPQQFHSVQVLPACIAAVHAIKDRIRPALERKMELAADLRVGRKRLCNGFVDEQRFERAEADASDPVHRAGAVDRVQQRFRAPLQVAPVARQMDAREHDLAIPLACKRGHFPRDLFGQAGFERPAGIRNDAVGTVIHATVLNLERGARA
jgi:hypothetical protein